MTDRVVAAVLEVCAGVVDFIGTEEGAINEDGQKVPWQARHAQVLGCYSHIQQALDLIGVILHILRRETASRTIHHMRGQTARYIWLALPSSLCVAPSKRRSVTKWFPPYLHGEEEVIGCWSRVAWAA